MLVIVAHSIVLLPFITPFFFFTDPAPPDIYTLSLHDALPISRAGRALRVERPDQLLDRRREQVVLNSSPPQALLQLDRKSTRLNSSHVKISYAVFCLKKKKTNKYID